jgi:hypothetical protein
MISRQRPSEENPWDFFNRFNIYSDDLIAEFREK